MSPEEYVQQQFTATAAAEQQIAGTVDYQNTLSAAFAQAQTATLQAQIAPTQTQFAQNGAMTETARPNYEATVLAPNYVFSGQNANWTPVIQGFDGIEMVYVPAGCFTMGSNEQEDEQPIHEQCFDAPFWIDLTEVTQADFERLGGVKANPNQFDGDQRPVEWITWFEARDFCALRGARLPTEAEWEYAARGPAAWEYPWEGGWNASNAVWSNHGDSQGTANVGSLPAGRSWVGALDMSGNVWEWVSSLYLPYDSQGDREADIGNPDRRVLRGGSWNNSNTDDLRAGYRNMSFPTDWLINYGFRCARSS